MEGLGHQKDLLRGNFVTLPATEHFIDRLLIVRVITHGFLMFARQE